MTEDMTGIRIGEELYYVRIIDSQNIKDVIQLKIRTIYEDGWMVGVNLVNGEATILSPDVIREQTFRSYIEAKKFSDKHVNKLQRQLTKETQEDGNN